MNNQALIPVLLILLAAAFFLYKKRVSASAQRQQQVKLVEKQKLTHDTYLFTFLLENQTEPLGLKVGEHVEIRANMSTETNPPGELIERKYTPVSEVTKKGSFDLLVKIYRKCEKFPLGGRMTQWLEAREIGDTITIRHPFGRFNYLGGGRLRIRNFGDEPPTVRTVSGFYMIAGGTGITPLYQLIQAISLAKQPTKLILFTLNRTQDDILLQDELTAFTQSNPNLTVFYSVDINTKPETWKGFSGFINKEKVEKTMGEVKGDVMCLSCGPPILSNLVEKIWGELGVKTDDMFRF